ncbi:MAG: isochorismate synthase [Rothia sp. (in: high G+C Gram-positive bacteria)]|nr:isochorismate synthase [Rothia sp. (in: high G+C Gram-positive bacteria)]
MPKYRAKDLSADFQFSTPEHTVRTRGQLTTVSEEAALATAQELGSGVIGLIPFEPDRPAFLAVPEQLEIGPAEEGQVRSLPAPSSISGQDNPVYRKAVGAALAKIHAGQLEKVVLARLLELHYEQGSPPVQAIFANLRAQQPKAFVFSVKYPGEDTYLMGASPELVFGVQEGKFTTFPLAGSAARKAAGASTEDAQIAEALLRSAKDRAEHATVVADIKARLQGISQNLEVPAVPQLLATAQLWHLATKITGRLAPGVSALDGARALHPTPAICGSPRQQALDCIRELEDFDRGYFGGLVGWMDTAGNGQWALVLRCAQVGQHKIRLFAGAGIVADSNPASEHAETASKLSSFGRALSLPNFD